MHTWIMNWTELKEMFVLMDFYIINFSDILCKLFMEKICTIWQIASSLSCGALWQKASIGE